MHTLAVLLFAVSVVTASPTLPIVAGNDTEEGSPNVQIVGGNDAPDGKYPYQVSVQHNSFPSCGGSIINSRFILTAAHCIYNKNPKSIKVVAGTNFYNLKDGGVTYSAEALICHSAYNQYDSYVNDIGLIQVDKEIHFSNKIQPIVLASTYYVPPGEIAILTGWGSLNSMLSTVPLQLQELFVKVMSQSQCESMTWGLAKNNICTYTTLNAGSCFGDSGSPLVLNGVQIGIVSYGNPCATGYPDVHTRVYSYKNWIESMTRELHGKSHGHLNRWSLLLLAISTLVSYSYSLS